MLLTVMISMVSAVITGMIPTPVSSENRGRKHSQTQFQNCFLFNFVKLKMPILRIKVQLIK